MPRASDITLCLIGFEQHKAGLDLSDASGFWLRVPVRDAAPFIDAFKASPGAFHQFQIEQRFGKETRVSTMNARIVRIEEGQTKTRVLILPDVPLP